MTRAARRLCLLVAVVAVSACAGPQKDRDQGVRHDARHQPSVTEPGLHISGSVTVGIRKRL